MGANVYTDCWNEPIHNIDVEGREALPYQYTLMLRYQEEVEYWTYNCYGYAVADIHPPVLAYPGGWDNFRQNVIVNTDNPDAQMKYRASYFNSENVANLICSDLSSRGIPAAIIQASDLPLFMKFCSGNGYAIMAVRAGHLTPDENGYVNATEANFHVILYTDGFWSAKTGLYGPLAYFGTENDFDPSKDAYWGASGILDDSETIYIIYRKTDIDKAGQFD